MEWFGSRMNIGTEEEKKKNPETRRDLPKGFGMKKKPATGRDVSE